MRRGGTFHLTLNTLSRSIAKKYHEGKMKRTLERELKVSEIVEGEACKIFKLLLSAIGKIILPNVLKVLWR